MVRESIPESYVERGLNAREEKGDESEMTTRMEEDPSLDATNNSEKENSKKVTRLDDDEDPKKMPKLQRWIISLIIDVASACVTFASSVSATTESGISKEFGISKEVSILSISLFVLGLGTGPLLLGPLSEFYGRWKVYVYSYLIMFALTFGVAFSPNAACHLILRFLTGFCGAAFLSVAGGSVGDLFADHEIAYPMIIYTMGPNSGPVLGPLVGGFINQHVNWRWTYYVVIIWEFINLVLLAFFVPETYEPVLLQRKAARLRKETRDESWYAPLDRRRVGWMETIAVSCYKPFEIMIYEPMALLLDIWSSLVLGILYLTFQAFPIIFGEQHGFSEEFVGLSFLGIGVGILIVPFTQPIWGRIQKSEAQKYIDKGIKPPPEIRLIIGFAGAILCPLSLLLLSLTSFTHVHWVAPIIASAPFGTGTVYSFVAAFTYLVVVYREYAASAMAGNTFLRCSFAAGFPLFAGPMFEKLGSPAAVGILAGLLGLMIPFPFLFYRYGERIRRRSRFANSEI